MTIDFTKPLDGVPASKADLRANLQDAEIRLAALEASSGGDLDGAALVDYVSPHVPNVSGNLTQSAHGGRACLIVGSVTVPVANGFVSLLRNKSGQTRTVLAASGALIYDGTTVASVGVPHHREVSVHSDGTDVWVSGAIA